MGILVSERYVEEVKGQHIPMISEEQFYKVQAILDGRNLNIIAHAKRNFENKDFPLRRIIKCERCDKGMTGAWSRGRHGGKFAYYRCSSKCTSKSIKVADLEGSLISLLKQITPKEECLNLFIHFFYKAYYERLSRLNKIKNESDTEIARLKALRNTLVEKNLAGIYSVEVILETEDLNG
jgi:site-specific DNA recombinase